MNMREFSPEKIPQWPEVGDINLSNNTGFRGLSNDHMSVISSATLLGLMWLVGFVIAAILLTLILLFLVRK